MTEFRTSTGGGKYSLTFETDNHEHYEYMQRAARICIDGHFFGCHLEHSKLMEECSRLKSRVADLETELAAAQMETRLWREMHGSVEQQSAALEEAHAEIKRLRSVISGMVRERDELEAKLYATEDELKDEIYRHDRLQDFDIHRTADMERLALDLDHWKQAAEERKLLYNIAMHILDEAGVDMQKFIGAVAAQRVALDKEA